MAYFYLEKREKTSQFWVYLSPLVAFLLSIFTSLLLFVSLGYDPFKTIYFFFIAPLKEFYNISELMIKATPLILIALGLAISSRAKIWNIGAEGQFILGTIFSTWVVLHFEYLPSFFLLSFMLIAGAIGGLLWASIAAFLKSKLNVNEILTTLMLNYIAFLLLSFLVHGPWKDPHGLNFPETKLFEDQALLPILFEGTRSNISVFFVLITLVIVWFVFKKLLFGYQINVIGLSPRAASFAGFSIKKTIWISLLCGGALAGIAGMFEIAGPLGQLSPNVAPGYGYTAIIVAFLGRLHPLGILFAGILMAITYIGGELAQIELQLPLAVTGTLQGMLLFFLVSTDVFSQYKIKIRKSISA